MKTDLRAQLEAVNDINAGREKVADLQIIYTSHRLKIASGIHNHRRQLFMTGRSKWRP